MEIEKSRKHQILHRGWYRLYTLGLLCITVIFRLGGDLAKSQPLNDGMRPGARWDPSSNKQIFELGGTWRWVVAQAGVLWVAATPTRTKGCYGTDRPQGARQGASFLDRI
jgi:hypothetical protein